MRISSKEIVFPIELKKSREHARKTPTVGGRFARVFCHLKLFRFLCALLLVPIEERRHEYQGENHRKGEPKHDCEGERTPEVRDGGEGNHTHDSRDGGEEDGAQARYRRIRDNVEKRL